MRIARGSKGQRPAPLPTGSGPLRAAGDPRSDPSAPADQRRAPAEHRRRPDAASARSSDASPRSSDASERALRRIVRGLSRHFDERPAHRDRSPTIPNVPRSVPEDALSYLSRIGIAAPSADGGPTTERRRMGEIACRSANVRCVFGEMPRASARRSARHPSSTHRFERLPVSNPSLGKRHDANESPLPTATPSATSMTR